MGHRSVAIQPVVDKEMERYSFYVIIETVNGRTYQSDTQGIREYVNKVFMNSNNIPIEGCWDKVQHYVDSLSAFNSTNHRIYFPIKGRMTYFNPAHVTTITLVRV